MPFSYMGMLGGPIAQQRLSLPVVYIGQEIKVLHQGQKERGAESLGKHLMHPMAALHPRECHLCHRG